VKRTPTEWAHINLRAQERGRWRVMLQRCENPRFSVYRYYGARGIKVCDRWHDFENFFADTTGLLGPCPPDMSMDRINNDGDYEPGNIRWATRREQLVNSRNFKPRRTVAAS
jgi:hypothetical protein